MNEKYCESCGMPMGDTDDMFGTEVDGSKSKDYCKYCYEDGKFTSNCTQEEMVEICVPHMLEANAQMNEDQARGMMKEFLPTLKRWK